MGSKRVGHIFPASVCFDFQSTSIFRFCSLRSPKHTLTHTEKFEWLRVFYFTVRGTSPSIYFEPGVVSEGCVCVCVWGERKYFVSPLPLFFYVHLSVFPS